MQSTQPKLSEREIAQAWAKITILCSRKNLDLYLIPNPVINQYPEIRNYTWNYILKHMSRISLWFLSN